MDDPCACKEQTHARAVCGKTTGRRPLATSQQVHGPGNRMPNQNDDGKRGRDPVLLCAAKGAQAPSTRAAARRQDNCAQPVHGSTNVRQGSAADDRDVHVRDLLHRAAVFPINKTLSERSVASIHAQGPQRRSVASVQGPVRYGGLGTPMVGGMGTSRLRRARDPNGNPTGDTCVHVNASRQFPCCAEAKSLITVRYAHGQGTQAGAARHIKYPSYVRVGHSNRIAGC